MAEPEVVILFPIAAIWLVVIVVWAIRKGVFEAPPPPGGELHRRPPRKPGPHGRRDRRRSARRARRRETVAR